MLRDLFRIYKKQVQKKSERIESVLKEENRKDKEMRIDCGPGKEFKDREHVS